MAAKRRILSLSICRCAAVVFVLFVSVVASFPLSSTASASTSVVVATAVADEDAGDQDQDAPSSRTSTSTHSSVSAGVTVDMNVVDLKNLEFVHPHRAVAEKEEEHEEEEHHSHAATAVLFPWFAEIIGVVTFFVLSRKLHFLPYTAIMFLIGTVLGLSVTLRTNNDNDLAESIRQWVTIDGHVLLLVFLPGLLFKDALEVDFYLFKESFAQLLLMAFPMVLAGTCLTALIGYYIFPYGWSWSLAMSFGSILAATDPVAVAVLLNEGKYICTIPYFLFRFGFEFECHITHHYFILSFHHFIISSIHLHGIVRTIP